MLVHQLIDETRQVSREDFLARYPHLFFVFHEERAAQGAMAFRTEMASSEADSRAAGALTVAAVTKAAQSPYADRISIGRARNCDVVLRHPSVSKLHAYVRREGEVWRLVDNTSQNGTFVGGERLAPGASAALPAGSVVTFGTLTVRALDAAELRSVLARLAVAIKLP